MFQNNNFDELIVPSGALPNVPQVVIGPHIPQEMIDRYFPETIAFAILKRIDDKRYTYQAVIGTGTNAKEVFGIVNKNRTAPGTSQLAELWSVDYKDAAAVPRIFFGSDILGEDQPSLIFPSAQTILTGPGWQIVNGEGNFKQLYQNTTPIKAVYPLRRISATANVSIGNTDTAIPGASIDVPCAGTFDDFLVTAFFSVTALVNPTSEMVGNLQVDGVVRPGAAGPVRFFTVGEKTMVTRQFGVTGLAAGTRTFSLSAVAGAAAQYQVNTLNTGFSVVGTYGGQ